MPDSHLPSHLATITPCPEGKSDRVLSFTWNLFGNAIMMAIPLVITAAAVAGGQLVAFSTGIAAIRLILPSIGLAIGLQVLWLVTFPEWPSNQILSWRLSRAIMRRQKERLSSRNTFEFEKTARMVEWVPRENWMVTRLETAEDIMLIDVSEQGVRMAGDRQSYFFPPASIIDVQAISIRPRGCFHKLHFAVLTIRTEKGPMEFPLSFRDAQLGGLRSAARLRDTMALQHSIETIASGGDFTYHDVSAYCDQPHETTPPAAKHPFENPYASPRTV